MTEAGPGLPLLLQRNRLGAGVALGVSATETSLHGEKGSVAINYTLHHHHEVSLSPPHGCARFSAGEPLAAPSAEHAAPSPHTKLAGTCGMRLVQALSSGWEVQPLGNTRHLGRSVTHRPVSHLQLWSSPSTDATSPRTGLFSKNYESPFSIPQGTWPRDVQQLPDASKGYY